MIDELPDGWALDEDHPFVGMGVEAETGDGETVAGKIAAIWVYNGEPRRMDIERDDQPPLNVDRERVGVTG